jgi:hypothetical protein
MRLLLESTDYFAATADCGKLAVWRGVTGDGVPVRAFVYAVWCEPGDGEADAAPPLKLEAVA